MSEESVLSFEETVAHGVVTNGIQITDGMITSILTTTGKKGKSYLAEYTAEEQAVLKEAFGIVSAKGVKKEDATSAITKEKVITEIEDKIEVDVSE